MKPLWVVWVVAGISFLVMRSASGAPLAATAPALDTSASLITDVQPVIMAGVFGQDTPDARIDPNTVESPFAGVGSLGIDGNFVGSAVLISPRHLLTAGHVVDLNNDGEVDVSPARMTFHLNYGANSTHIIGVSVIMMHPNFSGFANPVLNDDIAILVLSVDVPAGVPIYALYDRPVEQGDVLTLVGYGRSGWGDLGFHPYFMEDFNRKRVGWNVADLSFVDDDGLLGPEVFVCDFDGPNESTNYVGGLTLGIDIETTLGFGDSGGPAFILENNEYKVAGINTFIARFTGSTASPPLFGSAGGGIMVYPAAAWIADEAGLAWTVNALALNVQGHPAYVRPNTILVIDMDVSELAEPVSGLQAFLNFSSAYFRTDVVSIEAGGGVWDQLIWSQLNTPQPGDLDVAVGVQLGTIGGTQADGTVAVFTLTVAPEAPDGETTMVFRPDCVNDWPGEQDTSLASVSGYLISPATFDSQTIVIDGTDPVVVGLTATQDQGAGAVDVLDCAATTLQGTVAISVDASDALAGLAAEPAVTVTQGGDALTVTYAGESPAGTFNYTVDIEADTANGTWTISATAADKAGNDASVSGTLCVNKNQITGQIELEGFVGTSRTVTFVATGGTSSKTWTPTLTSFTGAIASFELTDVPDGSTHVSAKTEWTLRSRVALSGGDDNQWTADLIGDDKLLGGDLNGSNFINILDYSILANLYGGVDPVADIDGGGYVNVADYSMLATNYFQPGDDQ